MDNKEWLERYREFKKDCLEAELFDIDEIIKLFEVWLHQLS